MRPSSIAVAILLAGCAANPQSLCASLVPPTWTYLPQPPKEAAGLEALLPAAPYKTNEGKLIASIRRLWYQRDESLLACTLARHATNDCSALTTEFARSGTDWSKVRDDGVLCNVAH
jgi:hypothetical protein